MSDLEDRAAAFQLVGSGRTLTQVESAFVERVLPYQQGRAPTFWDAIAELERHQDGRCARCGRREQHLLVDHDHATGLVRGLLCCSCNTLEGFGGTEWDDYRSYPPAAELGLSVRYERNGHVAYRRRDYSGTQRA